MTIPSFSLGRFYKDHPLLYLGPEDSSHRVHQQLLLLANHLPVHQLHVGAQDNIDLIFIQKQVLTQNHVH